MMEESFVEEVIRDSLSLLGYKDDREKGLFENKSREVFDVFDEEGHSIGKEYRGICHRLGFWHKAVHVLFINDKGEILLQKRNEKPYVDSYPGCLDVSVGGHVGQRKDLKQAAIKEIKEETRLEIDANVLKEITTYRRITPFNPDDPLYRNREIITLHKYHVNDTGKKRLEGTFSGKIGPDKAVTDIRWCTVDDVIKELHIGKVADGLVGSFTEYLRHGND